jgi:trimeric autotransporter adhesin
VKVDTSGTYEFAWTETNGICLSSDTITVVFHSLPYVSAGKDTIICINDNIQLQGEGTGSFSWEPVEVISNSTIKNPTAKPLSTTTFKVTLTDQYGCINTDKVLIEVMELPVADAGPDKILDYLFETRMDALTPSAGETGNWSLLSGQGEIVYESDPKTSISGLTLDKNKFIWKVTNGVCPASSDTITVTVNDLVIPTLITPNMDGKNDYFVLRGIETLGKTELIIFDRRGAKVYKNSDYDNKWNGVDYNENPLPDDTYFFTIKSQNGKSISGYIVIRR